MLVIHTGERKPRPTKSPIKVNTTREISVFEAPSEQGPLVLVASTRPIQPGKSSIQCQIEFDVTRRASVTIVGAHPSNRLWRCHAAPGTGDFNAVIVEQKERHGLSLLSAARGTFNEQQRHQIRKAWITPQGGIRRRAPGVRPARLVLAHAASVKLGKQTSNG